MSLTGVITALVSPFKDNQIDLDGYVNNIEFQIKSGVSRILPIGTTGEAPTLTNKEKDELKSLTELHYWRSYSYYNIKLYQILNIHFFL